MNCPKCDNLCTTRYCGVCRAKMPVGPGDRLLHRTQATLRSNREGLEAINETLVVDEMTDEREEVLKADRDRVITRISSYCEEVTWLARMIHIDAESKNNAEAILKARETPATTEVNDG